MTRSLRPGLRVAVTGGAQGIGRSIAHALHRRGARVAIGDIQADLVTSAAAATGAVGLPLDVADPDSFARFLEESVELLGGLDALVNNAGIMPIGPFLEESPDRIRRTVEIDIVGVLTGTRLAGRIFRERGAGHVVNIASVMGTMASPNAAAYSAAKFAVVGLGESLRHEWRGSGVHISTVCPGFVRTELIAGLTPPRRIERFTTVDPQDVAAAVVRVLSAERSRTVFAPRPVGPAIRMNSLVPTPIRDWMFRASGGARATEEYDIGERESYQCRVDARTEGGASLPPSRTRSNLSP